MEKHIDFGTVKTNKIVKHGNQPEEAELDLPIGLLNCILNKNLC